ncbi:hypothetical protein CHS0354_009300 [Potamilus streckersoni]|uniref:Valine--tRNA ligase, mitochondrial n=1 Tax=Potamilus streckersoni TaxID=2493646 RepID=A0AAE0VTC1_9BIVA|nr:hypothetical protein CHS0354_009300 [Potamilus streckersoni]
MATTWCSVRWICKNFGVKLHKWPKYPNRIELMHLSSPASSEAASLKKKSKVYEAVTYDYPTPNGEKKDICCPLPSAYSPQYVEAAWYGWWVKQGYFSPEYHAKINNREPKDGKPFVICLPPPNVTGTLHLGHALTNSIQDAIIRWTRMRGYVPVLWIPGCDHAGIATQVVVEKKLWQERKVTRHQLGREEFVKEVWKWKHEKGNQIYSQMKQLGSSLDWQREAFTMDEKLSRAVVEAFVRLHDQGLIYRSSRLVNWSCYLKSTISDIEVEKIPIPGRCKLEVPGYSSPVEFGTLTSFAYRVKGTDEEIVIYTTRPETMLGDVAVAVHPDDSRYKQLHGKMLLHPFEGRELPVICDTAVDMTFGSGAVKITPGHDQNDYDIAIRHNLPFIDILDDSGHMINVCDKFKGQKRFEVRTRLVQNLKEMGLFRGSESHEMVLPVCSRSKDIVEPRLKEQWYVDCTEMAQKALQAVEHGELIFDPEWYAKIWFEWLKNIKDWCISRQLWWGHQIPVYYARNAAQKDSAGMWVSGRNKEEALEKAVVRLGISADQIDMTQDEDVLDTWFSSALFPFSALGWPDMTSDFQKYYPSSLLETGSDIIFFWVARMVMLGQTLTGKLPFSQVLFHGILRDAHGRKMSKSLGNVVDPMDVINGILLEDLQKKLHCSNLDEAEIKKAKEGQRHDFPDGIPECGADALRFTLCSYDFKSAEINMDINHVQSNRHFCNKIWQGYNFVASKLEGFTPSPIFMPCGSESPVDMWILSRLSHMIESCDQYFKSHDLHFVTKALRNFWIGEFCDMYVECIKPVFLSEREEMKNSTRELLHFCVDTYLRALSPFMPFLSEELFQRLTPRGDNWPESICVSTYPDPKKYIWNDPVIDLEVSLVKEICTGALSLMEDYQLKKGTADVCVCVSDKKWLQILPKHIDQLRILSRAKSVTVHQVLDTIQDGVAISIIRPEIQVQIELKGLVDPQKELEKFHKKLQKEEETLVSLVKKTETKKFQEHTVPEIQDIHFLKISQKKEDIQRIMGLIEMMKKLT